VICDRSDGLAFDLLRNYKDKYSKELSFFILSTEKNKIVSQRAKKHKIKCYQGVSDKLSFIKDYLSDKFPQQKDAFKKIIYLGNDLNDYSSMRYCGFSVAPSDAHPEIKKIASKVLDKKGGEGFVRLFVEELLIENNLDIYSLLL